MQKRVIMLGNEAVVRGALEAGVQFVSTYPGTPASEIGDIFYKTHQEAGVYFEFSINEKVALEAGAGAAFSGLRTLVAMKNFGLNVASDFLLTLVYAGTKAGLVILVADDPGCSSSAQSELNSRGYSYLGHIPTLEPSTAQECKDFVISAFELSEKYKIPVMIRSTTRVALQQGVVNLGPLRKRGLSRGRFVKNPRQFVTLPPRVLEMKKELLEKIEKIRNEISERTLLNKLYNGPPSRKAGKKMGIVTAGVPYLYVMEALAALKLNLPVLKLGIFFPLPEKKIKNFIKGLTKVLVVEELEHWLEKEVRGLAKDVNCDLKVAGKDLLPEIGELKPEIVASAMAKFANKIYKQQEIRNKKQETKRSPQLCPGCPYRLTFKAVKEATKGKEVVFGGEIGCYMLAGLAPYNLQDYLFCMGSSMGIAHGIKKVNKGQKLIAFVGDSSFFHAGLPALLNTVYNRSNPLLIIMDNGTTAMTGHQPVPKIDLEGLVRACGVKHLKVIDPANQKELTDTISGFLNKEEVAVIIARRPCVFVQKQNAAPA